MNITWIIKVNGERGNDLKSLVKLIKAGSGKEIELTFLRTQQNEEIRVKNLEDQKRAKTIETSLRVVFDKVRGDSSETFVTMSQLEKAGLAIYRDAASIVLPNISPITSTYFISQ